MKSALAFALFSFFALPLANGAPFGSWELVDSACSDGSSHGALSAGLVEGDEMNSRNITIDFASWRMTTVFNADKDGVRCRFMINEIITANANKLVATVETSIASRDCKSKRGIVMDVPRGRRTEYSLRENGNSLTLRELQRDDFGACPKGSYETLQFKKSN